MSFRITPITSMVHDDPEGAKKIIVAAYKKAGASYPDTSVALDCTWRTLYRWVDRLGIREELAEIASKVRANRKVCPECRRPL